MRMIHYAALFATILLALSIFTMMTSVRCTTRTMFTVLPTDSVTVCKVVF